MQACMGWQHYMLLLKRQWPNVDLNRTGRSSDCHRNCHSIVFVNINTLPCSLPPCLQHGSPHKTNRTEFKPVPTVMPVLSQLFTFNFDNTHPWTRLIILGQLWLGIFSREFRCQLCQDDICKHTRTCRGHTGERVFWIPHNIGFNSAYHIHLLLWVMVWDDISFDGIIPLVVFSQSSTETLYADYILRAVVLPLILQHRGHTFQ